MTVNTEDKDTYSWWASLKHGGLLIAPARVPEFFPANIEPLSGYLADRLRRDVVRLLDEDQEHQHLAVMMDTVLEDVLGLSKPHWLKGSAIDSKWSHKLLTQETKRPKRIWQGEHDSVLPVFVADTPRLGIGKGRREVSSVIEWLRQANQKIALLTNGRQWRLIYAGTDYDAWCEWDIDLWFQEGIPSQQVTALRILLGKESLQAKSADKPSPLIEAIQASRRGQAELSTILGERVRQAVELLIQASSNALKPFIEQIEPRDIYIAATRIIMRCVVILFAEARDLLPRNNDIYNQSYGIQGLRDNLERLAGGNAEQRLRNYHSAWPRLISLFRLVYMGSAHESLPVPRYGGGLFLPGDKDSPDLILRALSVLESSVNTPNDAIVHKILDLLCRSKVKVRQGNSTTLRPIPVDFSDLSSEYIGILYEGLLDYELRRTPNNEPMVFLNVGDQPILPFSRLNSMTDKDLAQLFEKLKQKNKESDSEDQEIEEDAEVDTEDEVEELGKDEGEPTAEESIDEELSIDDISRTQKDAIQKWAERAVKAAKLIKPPRSKSDSRAISVFEQEVTKVAKSLIGRIVMGEEWFLVRWGGTRKGAGTFYTRPQLAVPTTRRTLQALAYDLGAETNGKNNKQDNSNDLRPKCPEDILALKVCDPAMGSGSFLVAALRYLTEVLVASLHIHRRLDSNAERTICRLADGLPIDHPSQEILPVPKDHPEFEERLRAKLKRHIVEKCLYGVDIDPLAVELARMALWIETMDRSLPFGFLDHKLKCGNSLVGCWFDQFQDYPIMAWMRKGGDENHTNGVYVSKEVWTKEIKKFRDEVIKPKLKGWITGQSEDIFEFRRQGDTSDGLHDEALAIFQQLHNLSIIDTEGRETIYAEKILHNPAFLKLKEAFDHWCAIWFWPASNLDIALTPKDFYDPLPKTKALAKKIIDKNRFFHWELEFPDVFAKSESGFDAIIGNPPWEVQKPNSKEFFSNIDPLYRTYGKQEALEYQTEYFKNETVEQDWLIYCSTLKALSNWNKNAAYPFGDQLFIDSSGNPKHAFPLESHGKGSFHKSQRYYDIWANKRSTRQTAYADRHHPFRHQGAADINTYKMFSEMAHALLKQGGYFGFIVPSGLYTDKGSTDLRELFLSQCQWQWLFGFINWNKIFQSIYYRFKFAITIVQKGGSTSEIKGTFSRYNIEDWENPEQHIICYPRQQVEKFSPKSKAILEIRNQRDLEVLEKIYANSILLGDQSSNGWGITYAREFDMTSDSKLFSPRPKWEEQGYRPDEYGHWLKGKWKPYVEGKSVNILKDQVLSQDRNYEILHDDIEAIALPLYEGRMVGQFDFSEKGWVGGKGRSAEWREIPFQEKFIEPQYLMPLSNFITYNSFRGLKIGYLDIGSSTNARSMVSTILYDIPCGNAVPILKLAGSDIVNLGLISLLNSYSYDFAVRNRLGGLHLNYFVIEETPLVLKTLVIGCTNLLIYTAQLCWAHQMFAHSWLNIRKYIDVETLQTKNWKSWWALTEHERLRIRCIIDAIVADLYKLEWEDFIWIMRDCDHSPEIVRTGTFMRTLDPKGFWRVDKEKDPELRHTVLSLVAFHELKRMGLDSFVALNNDEGWMLPETLRLADYGLGHDDRAKEYQPVASRLGPRFLPWQLEQSPAESWEECEKHAELINKILSIDKYSPKPSGNSVKNDTETQDKSFDQPVDLFGDPLQTDLFGNVIYPTTSKKRR